MIKNFLISLLFLMISLLGYTQENTSVQDSTAIVYEQIEKYSKKNAITNFFHRLIFRKTQTPPSKTNRLKRKFDSSVQGKIIRNININTLDPFGFSETDSTKMPRNFFEKAGNAIHIKTMPFAVRQNLLLKSNTKLDTLLLKESERLIRSERYIRRVRINPIYLSENKDSIDIQVNVLDSWSLIPNISPSTSRITYDLTERNFLGLGHSSRNRYRQNLNDNRGAFTTRYRIPNFYKTFIQTELFYEEDLNQNSDRGISMERPFYSHIARWAGGVDYISHFHRDSLKNNYNQYELHRFKYRNLDLWAGYAIPMTETISKEEIHANFILSARYFQRQYKEAPPASIDPDHVFSDETMYLFRTGFSFRKFIEDEYIFNHDIIEDIPVQYFFGITTGIQNKWNLKRPYIGVQGLVSQYYSWGYLSINADYGTFIQQGTSKQSSTAVEFQYFTPLFTINNWKIRNFLKGGAIIGNRRLNSEGDQMYLQNMNGFHHPKYLGTKKLYFTFQSQSYSPGQWAGFRFNPFINISAGMLGNSQGFSESKLYTQFGIGVQITNDYLVFNNFQLSLSFFPSVPRETGSVFHTNSLQNDDIGFQHHYIVEKPTTALYE